MSVLTYNPKENIILVVEAANRVHFNNPVLADLTVCQAILESNLLHTPSVLAMEYNNLFGIKGTGTDGAVLLPTHEYYNGEMKIVRDYFAKNKTLDDSIEQHRLLLEKERYKPVREAKTFEEAAVQIKRCGYATDNQYPEKLIKIFNNFVR